MTLKSILPHPSPKITQSQNHAPQRHNPLRAGLTQCDLSGMPPAPCFCFFPCACKAAAAILGEGTGIVALARSDDANGRSAFLLDAVGVFIPFAGEV